MAYDRYDTRNEPRDERPRWREERSHDRNWDREGGGREDRGFFERMGDEIGSWFGSEDEDRMRDRDRHGHTRGSGRDHGRGDSSDWDRGRREQRGGFFGRDRDQDWDRNRGYQPLTGDYGRSSGRGDSQQFFAAGGIGRGEDDRSRFERSQRPWGRDDYRRTSFAGSSERSDQRHDPHYGEWRQRQIDELDRDYDDYRREHQAKFESDFGGWREKRQSKRQMLGQIREHMEVVGNDQQHVGTVDRVAGDRIILTKSDPEAGGAHHSLSCTDLDRIEGDQVILDCSAEQAMRRWRDENRGRALFEREDQGSAGPHVLDRSFDGTYR